MIRTFLSYFLILYLLMGCSKAQSRETTTATEIKLWSAAKDASFEEFEKLPGADFNAKLSKNGQTISEWILDGVLEDQGSETLTKKRVETQLKKLQFVLNHGAPFPCKFKEIFNLVGLDNLNQMEKSLPEEKRCKKKN